MVCSIVEVGSAELWGEGVTRGEATGQAASPSQRQGRAALLVGPYLSGGVKAMDAVELIRRYQSGERSFPGAKLEGADLRRAVLYRVDLRGANMRGASLISADLNGAILSGADMRDAHLSYADLRDAKLDGVDLRDATVSEAELSVTASLKGAILPDGTVKR